LLGCHTSFQASLAVILSEGRIETVKKRRVTDLHVVGAGVQVLNSRAWCDLRAGGKDSLSSGPRTGVARFSNVYKGYSLAPVPLCRLFLFSFAGSHINHLIHIRCYIYIYIYIYIIFIASSMQAHCMSLKNIDPLSNHLNIPVSVRRGISFYQRFCLATCI
jgi:hypothetical protein